VQDYPMRYIITVVCWQEEKNNPNSSGLLKASSTASTTASATASTTASATASTTASATASTTASMLSTALALKVCSKRL